MKFLFKPSSLAALFVSLLSLYFFLPNIIDTKNKSFLPETKLNLGLDLQGGAHLLLKVDFDKYLLDQFDIMVEEFRKIFRQHKIGYKNLHNSGNNITFSLTDAADFERVKSTLKDVSGLDFEINGDSVVISFQEMRLETLRKALIEQSIEIVRMRVDETGTKEPVIQRQGEDYILLEVPGLEDPSYLKNLLGKTAKLTFHMVDDSVSSEAISKGLLPLGSKLVISDNGEKLVIKKKTILSGDLLNDARVGFDSFQRPMVEFSLNMLGAKIFGEITTANVGKRLAIILDDRLLVAPNINEPIQNGRGSISGNYNVESASEFALLLRSGALPAPLKIVEERTVGPSLGEDSIKSGKISGMIGFLGVIIFMLFTYGVLGIIANITLILSLIYLISILSVFQASLTLPGIAGIILTIGMAVDANVLIYERIREEFNKGNSVNYSVRNGFASAFATIADSNVTTLIAALLLYIFGAGAIRGFAVALSAGIVASMFSAIVVSKVLIDLWVHLAQPKKLNI